jgi:hypothetical protein
VDPGAAGDPGPADGCPAERVTDRRALERFRARREPPLLRRIGSELGPATVNSRAVAPGTPIRTATV